jgi:murein DD-endopeptidase MepM/ murein hydrolase activator NlpD
MVCLTTGGLAAGGAGAGDLGEQERVYDRIMDGIGGEPGGLDRQDVDWGTVLAQRSGRSATALRRPSIYRGSRSLGDVEYAPAGFMGSPPRQGLPGPSARELPAGVPLDQMVVLSSFGPRARRMHSGIDLKGPHGAPVYVTAPGVVVHAGRLWEYGNVVDVAHSPTITTRYAHLSRVDVAVGQAVRERQVVGRVGATGRASGVHLHYEVIVDGRARNPMPYIRAGNAPATIPALSLAGPDGDVSDQPRNRRDVVGKRLRSEVSGRRLTRKALRNENLRAAAAVAPRAKPSASTHRAGTR